MSIRLMLASLFLVLSACKSAPIVPPNALPQGAPLGNLSPAWTINGDESAEQNLHIAVEGEFAYLAHPKGGLRKINLAGQTLWSVNEPEGINAGVGAADGVVAIADQQGTLKVYASADGKKMWQQEHANELLGPPLISAGRVMVRTADGLILGYNQNTGVRVWLMARPIGALSVRSHQAMLSVGSVAFAGGPQGIVFAFNPANGQLLWERAISRAEGVSEVERLIDIVSAPVMSQATNPQRALVCAATFNGKTACVRAASGELVWQANVPSASGLAVVGDSVVVVARNDSLHSLSLESGASRYTQSLLFNRALGAPLVVGETLFAGDGLGFLLGFNVKSGQLIYAQPTAGAIREVSGLKDNPRYLAQAPVRFGDLILIQSRLGEISAWALPR